MAFFLSGALSDKSYFKSSAAVEKRAPAELETITDEILLRLIDENGSADLLQMHEKWTEARETLDCSSISQECALKWLSALPGETLKIDGEAFPFPTKLDVSKEKLQEVLSGKTGLETLWVEWTDNTMGAICDLIEGGQLIRLKVQGGFGISETNVERLVAALLTGPKLRSLELSNIRLSTVNMIALSQVIPGITGLEKLTLEANGIHPEVLPHFVGMITKCPNLKEMKFTFSKFKELPGIQDLIEAAGSERALDLSANWDFC